MIWGTLRPQYPVMGMPRTDKPIVIHGLRDAGEPSSGEPILLMLDTEEAKIVIESLQAILKAEGK